ncbi:MAG: hypothetical protein JW797_07160 [Bradymonadales bacterium]|nr:hypothetical protein [Bradymonadales bacterium]
MSVRPDTTWFLPVLLSVALLAVWPELPVSCAGTRYQQPTEGPRASLELASICIQRATFYALINGRRTERYGCNETASWQVTPGSVSLVVQVEQADFTIEPLATRFEIGEGQCARFLLRQSNGYELEFFGVQSCP